LHRKKKKNNGRKNPFGGDRNLKVWGLSKHGGSSKKKEEGDTCKKEKNTIRGERTRKKKKKKKKKKRGGPLLLGGGKKLEGSVVSKGGRGDVGRDFFSRNLGGVGT